jgi:hypothetical protein
VTTAADGAQCRIFDHGASARANGLRAGTYMHRAYIAGVILFGLSAIGQAPNQESDSAAGYLVVQIGFGVAGLLNRRPLAGSPRAGIWT